MICNYFALWGANEVLNSCGGPVVLQVGLPFSDTPNGVTAPSSLALMFAVLAGLGFYPAWITH